MEVDLVDNPKATVLYVSVQTIGSNLLLPYNLVPSTF